MSKNNLICKTINILSHYGKENCKYCEADSQYFYSVYIPIDDKMIKWESPKYTKIDLQIFNNYYILTICTKCNHLIS